MALGECSRCGGKREFGEPEPGASKVTETRRCLSCGTPEVFLAPCPWKFDDFSCATMRRRRATRDRAELIAEAEEAASEPPTP